MAEWGCSKPKKQRWNEDIARATEKRPWVLNWNLTQPQHFTHFNCSMTTCSNTDVLRPRPSFAVNLSWYIARIPQTETLGERNANSVADFLANLSRRSCQGAVLVGIWQRQQAGTWRFSRSASFKFATHHV